MSTAEDRIREFGNAFDEVSVHETGRRLGVQWAPWMGDWFTSLSPRNCNNNAEGPWDEWVDLAIRILRDPMTAKIRPDVHATAATLIPRESTAAVAESATSLTDEDLAERFNKELG